MGYIRSNQDWYAQQGDHRTPTERATDLRREIENGKHMPDSVREELEREIRSNEEECGS